MMKGKRTVYFSVVMGFIAVFWPHVSPATIAAWLPAYGAALLVGGIILRQLTNTPIFQREVAVVEQKLGITPDDMKALLQPLLDALPVNADPTALAAQIGDLAAAVGRLTNHPGLNPDLIKGLSSTMADAVSKAVAAIGAVPDAPAQPAAAPAAVDAALQPTMAPASPVAQTADPVAAQPAPVAAVADPAAQPAPAPAS